MKNISLVTVILLFFISSFISIIYGESENKSVKKCKIIVSGYASSCEKALENAKSKCVNKYNGTVTFEGLCTEQKDLPEDERYKKDIYCEVNCKN